MPKDSSINWDIKFFSKTKSGIIENFIMEFEIKQRLKILTVNPINAKMFNKDYLWLFYMTNNDHFDWLKVYLYDQPKMAQFAVAWRTLILLNEIKTTVNNNIRINEISI